MSWAGRLLAWLLALLRRERSDIGTPGEPLYLTRWTLLGRRFEGERGKLFLHRFWRSDRSTLHDHPWPFWSLVLWPGYREETPAGLKWYGPLSLLRRPATWRHRVVLGPSGYCWSLVWAGRKQRSWGFHCPHGFVPWRDADANLDRGLNVCGDREPAR